MAASIKEFIRNWKSVLLLLVMPLLVIGSFFASFNTEGLQRVPVGVISNDIAFEQFTSHLSEVLTITKFGTLEECLVELKQYKQYVCIDIKKDLAYRLDVYYDNTKTLVIWGVVNYIKTTTDWIKKEKTKELASKVIQQADLGPQYIRTVRSKLNSLNSNYDSYILSIDNSVSNVENDIKTIDLNLDSISSNIASNDRVLSGLDWGTKNYYSSFLNHANEIDQNAGYIIAFGVPYSTYGSEIKSKNNLLRGDIQAYNNLVSSSTSSLSSTSANSFVLYIDVKAKLDDIENKVSNFKDIKENLKYSKNVVNEVGSELNYLEYYINEIRAIDPEQVADPVQLNLKPTYLPEVNPKILERFKSKADSVTSLIKGETLLTLQVIFPKILLLVVMFVSFLTSNFICLSHLKSPANIRIRTMKSMFFPSFLSIYVSSLLITAVPVACVILLGNFVFLLPFFENIPLVLVTLFISASIYIYIGMGISYLIKEKSLALFVSIFALIFLLFFSGFILPVERMGRVPSTVASQFPGNLAADILNKLLFYDQPANYLLSNFIILFATLILTLLVALLIKYLRDR